MNRRFLILIISFSLISADKCFAETSPVEDYWKQHLDAQNQISIDNILKIKKELSLGTASYNGVAITYDSLGAYVGKTGAELQTLLEKYIPLSEKMAAATGTDPNKTLEIKADETVLVNTSINVGFLNIKGKLIGQTELNNLPIEIKAQTIIVSGTFEVGNDYQKFKNKLTISLKHRPMISDLSVDHGYRGLLVNRNATLKLMSADLEGRAKFTKLNQSINTGSNTLTVGTLLNWQESDEVVVAPTSYDSQEAESFNIQGLSKSGNTTIITGGSFNGIKYTEADQATFQYHHWGNGPEQYVGAINGTISLDQRAEVANLTRNIKIQSDETDFTLSDSNGVASGIVPETQLGAHVMIHEGGQAFIDGVEFYKMGQAGILGRYPFHWHQVGNATGQYIRNSSIHHSFQRCITIHRTSYTMVENNVCYNFKGHGFFLEEGSEINNTLNGNLGIGADYPSAEIKDSVSGAIYGRARFLLASDNPTMKNPPSRQMGRFAPVSVFWISNPNNTVINNTAAGSVGTGFWNAFTSKVTDNDPFSNTNGRTLAYPLTNDTLEYSNNIAHSTLVGHTWDGAPASGTTGLLSPLNPNNSQDRKIESAHYDPYVVPIFQNLIAYKNIEAGIYFRGETAVYDHAIVADSGWAFFLAYNQIVKNSTIIAKSSNFGVDEEKYLANLGLGKPRPAGITMYDGPFEIENVDFLNFPQQLVTYTDGSKSKEYTATALLSIGGWNKYTNLVNNISFSPNPLYRVYGNRFESGTTVTDAAGWGEPYLASHLRDDSLGSLTGKPNGLLVPSHQFTNQSCTSRADLVGFQVCPAQSKALTVFFTAENGPTNRIPFVIRKAKNNSSQFSLAMNEWSLLNTISNMQGAVAYNKTLIIDNSEPYIYEIIIKKNITNNGVDDTLRNLMIRMTGEVKDQLSPVLKIKGYGADCRLSDGSTNITPAISVEGLKAMTSTSYYAEGNDIYVKLKANNWVSGQINIDYYTTNPTNRPVISKSDTHESAYFKLICNEPVAGPAIGRLDDAVVNNTIRGWACNFGQPGPVQIKFYVGDAQSNPVQMQMGGAITANQYSDANIAFNCGDLSGSGHRFSFQLPQNVRSRRQGQGIRAYVNNVEIFNSDHSTLRIPTARR